MNRYQLEERDLFAPDTSWQIIPDSDIIWRNYKHWGTEAPNVMLGHGPMVYEARFYVRGDMSISAVFSPPMGIAPETKDFWEIYIDWLKDNYIERYFSEEAMISRVVKILIGA